MKDKVLLTLSLVIFALFIFNVDTIFNYEDTASGDLDVGLNDYSNLFTDGDEDMEAIQINNFEDLPSIRDYSRTGGLSMQDMKFSERDKLKEEELTETDSKKIFFFGELDKEDTSGGTTVETDIIVDDNNIVVDGGTVDNEPFNPNNIGMSDDKPSNPIEEQSPLEVTLDKFLNRK